jgi:hypothetical protein
VQVASKGRTKFSMSLITVSTRGASTALAAQVGREADGGDPAGSCSTPSGKAAIGATPRCGPVCRIRGLDRDALRHAIADGRTKCSTLRSAGGIAIA